MNIKNRFCPICEHSEKRILFKQNLILPEGSTDLSGYEIVVCTNCGFLFADKTVTQDTSDAHYARDTKTALELSVNKEPERDIIRLNNTFNVLSQRLNLKKSRVLDIGCGTGYLLGLLKKTGTTNLLGIDQSSVAANIGIRSYGVKIDVLNAFDLIGDTFDVILLCHVLEHIVDISEFISVVHRLLSKSGIFYVEVPDALQFENFSDPRSLKSSIYVPDLFTHFTPEHVNYFTPTSLRNMMTRFGFKELFCESNPLGVIISAWRPSPPVMDPDGETCLLRYISESNAILDVARARIKLVAEEDGDVLVWGVGLHTQRLLALGDFNALRVVAFIDSSPSYRDRHISGINIINPEDIPNLVGQPPILISSLKSQSSILKNIENLNLPNKIITLY